MSSPSNKKQKLNESFTVYYLLVDRNGRDLNFDVCSISMPSGSCNNDFKLAVFKWLVDGNEADKMLVDKCE